MNGFYGRDEYISREGIAAGLQAWSRAAITLMDIRHNLISPQQPMLDYCLPTSAFIYTIGGMAEVSLGEVAYQTAQFGLFHGAKGTELTIRPQCDWTEYYMVLYKHAEPSAKKREYAHLLEVANPFCQQYGFAPSNPLFFAELLRRMYEKWTGETPLNLFYGKAAFYQLVYEVYDALEQGDVQVFQPDTITMAQRYIEGHFDQAVSIQAICTTLGVSYSSFYRGFKQKTGKTPQEYLIDVRLNAAKQCLKSSAASIREIAEHCGFADEHSFFRMFTKNVGNSPSAYRQISHSRVKDDAIGNTRSFPYNEEGQVRHDELIGKGANYMLKQMRGKAVIAAAISLMMLLSACSTAPTSTTVGQSTPTPAVTTSAPKVEEAVPEEAQTKTISTTMGDVEVPVNPQRVVVQYLMGDVIALGITPVGISDVYDGAAFASLIKDSVDLGWMPEWEEESVMALDPDLILVSGEDDVAKFSKIAPTVYVPYGDMTQEERLTFMGEVLNKQDEAAKAIQSYQDALEQAKTKLAEAGFGEYTVTVMEGGADSTIGVYGDKYGTGGIVYSSLGLKAPDLVKAEVLDMDEYNKLVSFEVLNQYSGDFIIRNTYEGMADLTQDAIWNALPAIKNNRLIEMEFGFSYYTDVYSATEQINYVTDSLINASK